MCYAFHMSNIKDMLKEIILENQEQLPLDFVPRDLEIERIPKKATVVLGVRHSGKTSLLQEYISGLVKGGLNMNLVCQIDFSDDRLISINEEVPGVVADAYYELFPEAHDSKVYFLFDEIQYLNGWELLVNRLQNTEKCEVNITGSSSKLLLDETSSVLGGRKMGWNLYCYSYREFLRAKGELCESTFSRKFKDSQPGLFKEYLSVGGFPESLLFSKDNTRRIFFQNTANDIIFRDIVLRHDVSKPEALKTMVNVLASMVGGLMTESKLYKRLSGMHVAISKPTMSQYLDYIAESYEFFFIPIRSYNLAVQATNGKKVYSADHALANAISGLSPNKVGQKLENIVFLHLKRKTDMVFFYRTESGFEVDFASGPDDDICLVQVCADISSPDTLTRETRSLEEAMKELDVKESVIVALSEEKDIALGAGIIHVVPAWKYLLVD